jgi:hypothetical protein
MDSMMIAGFVFLVGLTTSGLASSVMQVATGHQPGFIAPFVSQRFVARSLLATLLAGPMMLCNETSIAWRERRIGWAILAISAAITVLWAFATGVLVMELAHFMNQPL